MSIKQKNNLANTLTLLVLVLTAFQGLIPTMPIDNATVLSVISAIVMFLVTGLTAWKQYLSTSISNSAINPTMFVFVLALLGGANDLFAIAPLGETANQWLRFGLTFITLVINLVSKTLYPQDINQPK